MGSSRRVWAASGSKYARACGVSDSGSFGDAPQHDARVVLVAGDELADRLPVGLPGGVVDGVRGEGGEPLAAEDPAAQADVEADGGSLVDHDDAAPVGVVQHLLGVGVVRGAERVGAQPVQQREVMHHEYVVVALAAHGGVFVLAEAPEVERLAVDEEARAVDLDGADADRQRIGVHRSVAIAPQQDGQIVEVTFTRPPRAGIQHGELPLAAGGPCGLGAVGVGQHEAPWRPSAPVASTWLSTVPADPVRPVMTVRSLMCAAWVV